MLPRDWGMQTYGENLDWLEAANDREYASLKKIQLEAWYYGIAFNATYVAARNEQYSYPKSVSEMFPPQNGEDMPSDLSEEEIWARQERMWDLEMNRMAAGLEAAAKEQAEKMA
ncbi:MAG: hypothetical protein GX832_00470 [Clostridiales bacterium]|nr:hypothetical protein [Clostridiales bacterium]